MNRGLWKQFFEKKVVKPITQQLTQGVTPHQLALSCALGLTLGIFPILGSTTLLCLAAGFFLKLNQPSIQVVNYLIYPVQLALMPVFVRMGEYLFQADPISFSPMQLSRDFMESPSLFMSKFGAAGLYGIVIWLILAPFLIGGLTTGLSRLFTTMNEAIQLEKNKLREPHA